jgi:hypothetical protein
VNPRSRDTLRIAEALKGEAGVTHHIIRKSLSGCAYWGRIEVPEGKTRCQLYILAHECAHIVLGHIGKARKPRHLEEVEAERWAHEALRRYGVAVSFDSSGERGADCRQRSHDKTNAADRHRV